MPQAPTTNQLIHLRDWTGRRAKAACKREIGDNTTTPNKAKVTCPTCLGSAAAQ